MKDDCLDKYQVGTARLADTIFNFYAGAHPSSIADTTRASMEMVSGVHNFYQKHKLIPNDKLIENNFVIRNLRLTSNFSKHADRDPNARKPYAQMLNMAALRQTAIAHIKLTNALYANNLISIKNVNSQQDTDNKALTIINEYSRWSHKQLEPIIKKMMHIGLKEFSETVPKDMSHKDVMKSGLLENIGRNTSLKMHACREFIDQKDELRKQMQNILEKGLWPVEYDVGLKLVDIRGIDFTDLYHDLDEIKDTQILPLFP